ncbi:MAG: N-acetylmuramoyl-L-alanine amidase, partial [Bacteroidota bacterium]|nr:N-acetylmuramoyl-L-alanine amidase [Bacteroidota bacterium]
PKSSESYIIFTLMQNVFQKQSTDLALKMQTQFAERVERKNRGVKQAGFWVLLNSTRPSVLVETGFVSNSAVERFINSRQGQDYMASAIYRACRDYVNEIDSRSGISAVKADQPEISSGDKIEDPVQENKLVFMVQIATAATGKEIKPENFNGINEITELKANDRFKYATGRFDNYPEAVKHRKKIEAIYPDAFVIAVKDNKILPLQQALEQKRKSKQ